MANEGRNLLIKLLPQNIYEGLPEKKKPKVDTVECVEELIEFLESIKKENKIKDYHNNKTYIIGCIFKKQKSINIGVEFNNFAKVSFDLGLYFFKEVIRFIECEEKIIDHSTICKYKDILKEFLFDIKLFVEHFKKKKDPNYFFFEGCKQYDHAPIEVYRLSKRLLWSREEMNPVFENKKLEINLAVFTLRQSLELRFKRILGVYDIYNKSHNGPKLKHDFFPNLINKLKEHVNIHNYKLGDLMKLYKWTNQSIHNANNPFIWEILFAQDYLNEFFDNRKIEVFRFEELKMKVSDEIWNNSEEIVCIEFFRKPDAMLIDGNV